MAIRPVADQLFSRVAGTGASEFDAGIIGWSNELALHVLELKNSNPIADIARLPQLFHQQIIAANKHLSALNACLMPGGAHPFMNPESESKLWPFENDTIYKTYDRIFNCKGHGWTNLQSVHINLPFANDAEFARLHAAIRLVLPLIPALCASTPFIGGAPTRLMDTRLQYYRQNQHKTPLVCGHCIPERVYSQEEYEQKILQPMYQQIAPFDPEGIIQFAWLNSRGAIARFDRGAIEIRLMDIQESPAADIALSSIIIETIKNLVAEQWCSFEEQCQFTESELETLLVATITDASAATITSQPYLRALGFSANPLSARTLWQQLAERLLPSNHAAHPMLATFFAHGTLAERMVEHLGRSPAKEELAVLCNKLATCLQENLLYV